MNPHKISTCAAVTLCLWTMFGCSVTGNLQRRQATAHLSQLTRAERQERQADARPQIVKLQRDSNTFFLAPVDTLTDGERVMSLRIEQVTVVAKVRSVPERNGRVKLDFIVTLPKELLGRSRSVVVTPVLHKPDGRMALEDLVIRGGRFSLLQERDYWQYATYVERFRPDTVGREAAFNRFVKFPYPEDTRLDSVVERRGMISYYFPKRSRRTKPRSAWRSLCRDGSKESTRAPTECRHPIRSPTLSPRCSLLSIPCRGIASR